MGFLQNVNMLEPYQRVQAIKTNEIQQAVDTMKLEEMREEKKKQDTPIPFDMFLKRLSDMHGKSVADVMGEDIRKMGFVDEIPGADKQPIRSIKVKNIKNFNDYLNQYPENSSKYIGMELKSLEDREDELQKLAEKTTKEEEKNNIMQEIKDNQQKQLTVLKNAENNQKKYEKKQQILNAKRTIMETENDPAVKGVLDNLKRQAKSGDKDAGYILLQYMGARNSLLKGDITAKDFQEAQRHIMEKVLGKEPKPIDHEQILKDNMVREELSKGKSLTQATATAIRKASELKKTEDPLRKDLAKDRMSQSWNKQIDALKTKDPFNSEFYESIREKGLDLIDEGKSPQKLLVKPKEMGGKLLDEQTAKQILKEADGNKEKARKIARDRGYKL